MSPDTNRDTKLVHSASINATLSGDVNDYNPTGFEGAIRIRITVTGANRAITGFTTTAIGDGRVYILMNVGASNNFILKDEDGASGAGQRFALDGVDISVPPKATVVIIRDSVLARWVVTIIHHDRPVTATETVEGITEIATQIEVNAGLDISRMLTPANVRGAIVVRNNVITPPAFSGDVNNYNPTGLGTAHLLRLDSGGAIRDLTGIVAQEDGRFIVLLNISTSFIRLRTEDVGSTDINRFKLIADLTLGENESVTLWYDTVDNRWRARETNV